MTFTTRQKKPATSMHLSSDESKAAIVIPVLNPREDWLVQAARSALNQSVRCQLIVVYATSAPGASRALRRLETAGGNLLVVEQSLPGGFADCVDLGFRHACSARVGLLLSDDWLHPMAVEYCLAMRADIVSTGQDIVTADGRGVVMTARPSMRRFERMATLESKARHLSSFFLLRRSVVLEAGGVGGKATPPGSEYFELMRRLLERGASVEIITEPLYYRRCRDEEQAGTRRDNIDLPTDVGAPRATTVFARLRSGTAPSSLSDTPDRYHSRFEDFRDAGFTRADYFDHDVLFMDKPYPDTHLILENAGILKEGCVRGRFIQLNLYTRHPEDLPNEVWFHPKLVWHQQQMELAGLVGSAGLFLTEGGMALISTLQSDIVQQLYRHPGFKSCKSRIEGRYRRWYKMLLNAVLSFAAENAINAVYCPTSETVLGRTRMDVREQLYSRVYDYPPRRYEVKRIGINRSDYWMIDVRDNRDFIAALQGGSHELPDRNTICLLHDIEGHLDTAASLKRCLDNVQRMAEIEHDLGLPATYNVPGMHFDRFAHALAGAQYPTLGFHSYNHRIEDLDQLRQVRKTDLQIKGYRPPRSVLTDELSDYRLAYYNFEWLASSTTSLGFQDCRLAGGIVKIPIFADDHPLHAGAADFATWSADIVRQARARRFYAFSMRERLIHDWLDGFSRLLEALSETHEFVTCDQVAGRLFLSSSRYRGW